jgi:hypothetical protein
MANHNNYNNNISPTLDLVGAASTALVDRNESAMAWEIGIERSCMSSLIQNYIISATKIVVGVRVRDRDRFRLGLGLRVRVRVKG